MPVTHVGYARNVAEGYYVQNPGADLPVNQLARQPTTGYSRGIRLEGMPQIRTIIEAAWEGVISSGVPADEVLATAQRQGDAVIASFART